MGERIRIIGVPPGQAPLEVRKQWVGLELPVDGTPPEPSHQMGARFGQPENLGGYRIRTEDAMLALVEKAPDAASWWNSHLPLAVTSHLVFRRDVCEVIPEETPGQS